MGVSVEGGELKVPSKKSVLRPSRFEPPRIVKPSRMPSQQDIDAEKEARTAEDRRCEEMAQAMEIMKEEFATLRGQLQQEMDARRTAAEAVDAARRAAQDATETIARLQASAQQLENSGLGDAPQPGIGVEPRIAPTLTPGNNGESGVPIPSPELNMNPSNWLWLQQAASVLRTGVNNSTRTSIPFSMTANRLPKFSREEASQAVNAWLKHVGEDAR